MAEIDVPRRERNDPGRVLYHHLRRDVKVYTVRMSEDSQSFVRLHPTLDDVRRKIARRAAERMQEALGG